MSEITKSYIAKEFLLGVCYYPEHWDRSMWEEDFKRISAMGFNVVRMAETAWNVLEAEEGVFTFEIFDTALELCKKYGLKVILGTPTYAPPAWLTTKYPEVLRRDFSGKVMQHGSRRHYNYTSEKYNELSRKIVTVMAEHYKNNPAVIGWQIDNELNCHMDDSYADSDHLAFREWCKEKYMALNELNNAWGTAFWAQTYTSWEQVYLPRPTATFHNPGHLLDMYKFFSDATIEYCKMQYDILKKIVPPTHFITHNGMFSNIDNYEITQKGMDFMSYDSYPTFASLRNDLPAHFTDRLWGKNLSRVRGISEKFMILEQQAGPGGQSGNVLNRQSWGDYFVQTPKPGQMRLWAWQSIVHGADALLFFRWRTCPSGAESLWHGLNHYGNQHHWRLDEAKKLADEIKLLGNMIISSHCSPECAIMYDYDNDSNCKIEGYIGGDEWKSEENIYMALNEKHFLTDMISVQCLEHPEVMDKYKIVFYPNAQLLEKQDVKGLKRYVENGGTLVLGPRSGYKDRSNRCYMLPFPGVVKDLCGIEVTDFNYVRNTSSESFMEFNGTAQRVSAPVFNDMIKLENEEVIVLARYDADYYKGEPAVTMVPVGKGNVVYFGCFFTVENTSMLMDHLGLLNPISDIMEVPKEVEVITRKDGEGTLYFLLNYMGENVSVNFKKTLKSMLPENEIKGMIDIAAYEVMVVRDYKSNWKHLSQL